MVSALSVITAALHANSHVAKLTILAMALTDELQDLLTLDRLLLDGDRDMSARLDPYHAAEYRRNVSVRAFAGFVLLCAARQLITGLLAWLLRWTGCSRSCALALQIIRTAAYLVVPDTQPYLLAVCYCVSLRHALIAEAATTYLNRPLDQLLRCIGSSFALPVRRASIHRSKIVGHYASYPDHMFFTLAALLVLALAGAVKDCLCPDFCNGKKKSNRTDSSASEELVPVVVDVEANHGGETRLVDRLSEHRHLQASSSSRSAVVAGASERRDGDISSPPPLTPLEGLLPDCLDLWWISEGRPVPEKFCSFRSRYRRVKIQHPAVAAAVRQLGRFDGNNATPVTRDDAVIALIRNIDAISHRHDREPTANEPVPPSAHLYRGRRVTLPFPLRAGLDYGMWSSYTAVTATVAELLLFAAVLHSSIEGIPEVIASYTNIPERLENYTTWIGEPARASADDPSTVWRFTLARCDVFIPVYHAVGLLMVGVFGQASLWFLQTNHRVSTYSSAVLLLLGMALIVFCMHLLAGSTNFMDHAAVFAIAGVFQLPLAQSPFPYLRRWHDVARISIKRTLVWLLVGSPALFSLVLLQVGVQSPFDVTLLTLVAALAIPLVYLLGQLHLNSPY